jgi:cyclase
MQRMTTIRLVGSLLAIGGLWTAVTQQPQQPVDLGLEKIADDLHIISNSGGNVAVLTTNEGVILVDDKFERNVPQIVEKVKSITNQPIKYIVNTHQHGDHTGGNAMMMKSSAETFCHENCRANMVKGDMPGTPRIAFRDSLTLSLGGKEIQARHLGAGHTNGDSVVYFPKHRVVHTGDLFVRGTPYIDYPSGGSSEAWIKTLDAILALDFDLLIPGHGAISKRADLVKWRTDFETARSRMRELARQGRKREEVSKALKVDDLPGWSIGGLFEKSLPAFYDEMARSK